MGLPSRWIVVVGVAISAVLIFEFYNRFFCHFRGFISNANIRKEIAQSASPAYAWSPICQDLYKALPDNVYVNPHREYLDSISSYWSLQECALRPQCVVKPRDTADVAESIAILRRYHDGPKVNATTPVRFTVRSGGHSSEAGYGNVNDGVVIDLSRINQVKTSSDSKSMTIGSGAHWSDVYPAVDEHGLAVVGGRAANVGVGGLTLGGGISYFSSRFGFVCNNVMSYELVLANGSVARASSSENSDLWRALKGGSGNLGVVTQFTVKAFPSDKLWGGYVYSTISKAPEYINALHEFVLEKHADEYAAAPIVVFSYVRDWWLSAVATTLMYTKPVEWPSCFGRFKAIPRIWSEAKIRTMSDAALEQEAIAPNGKRQYQTITSVQIDLETLREAYELWADARDSVSHVPGVTWSLVLQPLTMEMMRKGDPNVLGLSDRTTSLVSVQVSLQWRYAKDDNVVEGAARALIQDLNDFAISVGTYDSYRYLNYATRFVDPITGYGEDNVRFLKEVSGRYDPQGFFQDARAAGFKLDMRKV